MQNVTIIADYNKYGDLAFNEIKANIRNFSDEFITFDEVPVESFDSLQAGFLLYQLAYKPSRSIYFVNVAPRKNFERDKENKGEDLLYVELKNKNKILTTNSYYTLYYLKDDIDGIYAVNASNNKSQFRSRDFFSYFVAELANWPLETFKINYLTDTNLKDTDLACLKNPSDNYFAFNVLNASPTLSFRTKKLYVDSFGNIKTTARYNEIKQYIDVNKEYKASIYDYKGNLVNDNVTFNGSLFSVKEGEYSIYFGSSGFDNKFLEIALRSGNAYKMLNSDEFIIKLL